MPEIITLTTIPSGFCNVPYGIDLGDTTHISSHAEAGAYTEDYILPDDLRVAETLYENFIIYDDQGAEWPVTWELATGRIVLLNPHDLTTTPLEKA